MFPAVLGQSGLTYLHSSYCFVCFMPAVIRDRKKEKEGRERPPSSRLISSFFSTSPRSLQLISKYSFYVARIVSLLRMSDVCWRRTSRQGGAGSVRDGEQVQQNSYILQVKMYPTNCGYKTEFIVCSSPRLPYYLVARKASGEVLTQDRFDSDPTG